jgi:hypothetical protein
VYSTAQTRLPIPRNSLPSGVHELRNRFVKTALAIVAAGSAAHAGTGGNDWLKLDSEISGLASSLKPSQDGMGWAALIRAVFSYSKDDIATGGGNNPDTSGFNFNDVDLAFWGNQGPYRWRISADIDNNDAGVSSGVTGFALEDAYIAWNCGGYFDAMMGQFKPRVTHSNSVDPEKQVLIDRTAIGSAFDFHDDGIGASGTWEQLKWYASLLDGQNGHERDHLYFVRGEWNLGTGAGEYEGAMGSSDQLNGTVGVTVFHDDTNGDIDGDTNSDNTTWLADVTGNVSNVGFSAEVAGLDNDSFLITSPDFSNISDSGDGTTLIPGLALVGDSMPWDVTVSYLINPEWEVAVRYESLDNGDNNGPDNSVLTVGADWYRGNAGRWQAQWSKFDASNGFNDGSIFEAGYSIGSSR